MWFNRSMKDFSWSYSMYSKALDCLACFKRRYIDNEPELGPPSADLVFGSCVHSAWNAMLEGDDYESVYQMYWDSYAGKEMAYTRFKYDQLGPLGATLLKKFAKSQRERFVLDKSEIRLQGEYKGVKLNGQFDFYGKFDGETALMDLKTSSYNYPAEKQFTALQLNLYAYLAIQNGYEAPKKIGYQVLNKGIGSVQTPLVWDFSLDKCHEMLDDMTTYCKMFEAMTSFPRNPNCTRHNYDCYGGKE